MRHEEQGFIKIIIIIVIAVFALSYFNVFDMRSWLDSPEIKQFFVSTWESLKFITANYIIDPALRLWEFLRASIDKF